jgi:ubiquitin carboxyl-terminal hydrolase 4/11/15
MEETLSGNDKWFCGKCKDHVTAYKKMEVYKAPDYLIIHFKRFSHQRNVMFGSRKINDLVNFPTTGLDMSKYVVESTSKGDATYDLYAVSNHFGSLSAGHYTAFAKNPVYKKWFNFDDCDVSSSSESEVVTKAAYVLFYRRRGV